MASFTSNRSTARFLSPGRSRQTTSKYDSPVKRKRISQASIRKIISRAFLEFRGHELSEEKLKQFEAVVCEDSYIVTPEDAAKGILQLVETVQEKDLHSTFTTITVMDRYTSGPSRMFQNTFNNTATISIESIKIK